jgi:hypothetical protein
VDVLDIAALNLFVFRGEYFLCWKDGAARSVLYPGYDDRRFGALEKELQYLYRSLLYKPRQWRDTC